MIGHHIAAYQLFASLENHLAIDLNQSVFYGIFRIHTGFRQASRFQSLASLIYSPLSLIVSIVPPIKRLPR